jgi:TolB-like protein
MYSTQMEHNCLFSKGLGSMGTQEYSTKLNYSRQVLQRLCQLLLVALIIILLSSCSKRYSDVPVYSPFPMGNYENESVGRFKSSYIVDQIDEHYRGVNPGPIGVTTFVNADDLYSTSSFGRMYAEQVMSELVMRGFDVIELRHSDALQFMSGRGEFALSRDVSSVRPVRQLGAVVVGTYVVSPVRVYVNARLIDPSSSMILSSGSVEMSKTAELTRMVRGGAFATTLERIPVRHVGIWSYPMPMGQSEAGRIYDLEESGAGSLGQGSEPTFAPKKTKGIAANPVGMK